MKKKNFINRVMLIISALLITGGLHAQTSFNSFEIKSGFSAGALAFKGNDITVEFWINAPAAAVSTNSEIMESWHDPNGIRINMNAHEGGYALRLFAKSTTSTAAAIIIPAEYYVEKWAHIAYVISSADEKAYAYVNGEYFAEIAMTGGYYGNYRTNNSIRNFSFSTPYYGTPAFNGKLADVRIWSSARTADEIKANFNKHLEGTQENLYLNYTFYNCLTANNKPLINDANTGANNTGNLNNTNFAKAVLVQIPLNVSVSGDNTLSWNAANATDAYEVQIVDETGTEIDTIPVTANSLSLDGLVPSDGIYAAKVRTKSFINSDDLFIYSRWTPEVQFVSNTSIDLNSAGNFKAWTMAEGETGGNAGLITFPGETNPSARNLTVEFWLNMAEGILNDGTTIFNTSGNGTSGFVATVRNNNGLCQLRLFAKNTNNENILFYVPSEHYVNKWAHIAFVVSETDDKAYLYLNGELFGETVATGGWYGNNHNTSLVLGSAPSGWADPKFYGSLADFRIWSVARTADEIKANYNQLIEPQENLHINYTFANWNGGTGSANKITNVANPGTNDLTLSGNNHFRTVLAVLPQNLAIADQVLSWDTTAGEWEVTVFKADNDEEVYSGTASANSVLLTDIAELGAGTYYAKVRTINNGFSSEVVKSEEFIVPATGINENEVAATLYVKNGSLIVNAKQPQVLAVYAVSGQLVRRVNLVAGENVIKGLAKGFYLADNQKIIIR